MDESDAAGEPPAATDTLTRVGPYELGHPVAFAGAGVIYEAVDQRDQSEVAFKILHPADASEAGLERLHNTLEAVADLDHPHIVAIRDHGCIDDVHYCTFDRLDCRDLEAWSEERERSIRASVRMVSRIARAIAHAHEHGVVHGRLRPAKILVLRENDQPKIIDFGFSSVAGARLMGTAAYRPPETRRAPEQEIDPGVDVYALGVMLYQLLTGHDPFEAKADDAAGTPVPRSEPAPPRQYDSAISPGLERVLMQCLHPSREQRYGNAEDLANDLDRALADEPVHAANYGWLHRNRRTLTRVVVPLVLVAVVVGVLARSAMQRYAQHQERFADWELALEVDFTGPGPASDKVEAFDFIDGKFSHPVERWPLDRDGLHMPRLNWLWLSDLSVPMGAMIELEVELPDRVDGIDVCLGSQRPQRSFSGFVVPTGYSCQFGGYGNRIDFISANPKPQYPKRMASTAGVLTPGGTHTLRFEWHGDECRQWIDGELHQECALPIPVGEPRSGGIGVRTWGKGLLIKEIRVWRLSLEAAASPLVPADTMARYGHYDDAVAEYLAVADNHPGTEFARRALGKALVAEVNGGHDPDVTAELLERVRALPTGNDFRQTALGNYALNLWEDDRRGEALEIIDELLEIDPTDQTLMRCTAFDCRIDDPTVTEQLAAALRKCRGYLALDLSGAGLADLACIGHLPLLQLDCSNNRISDLTPLRDMPLFELAMSENRVSDLTPLQDISTLRLLMINHNQIADLGPLRGIRIGQLYAKDNRIVDLGPLENAALYRLMLSNNAIEDIGPLRDQDPAALELDHNRITSLEPLRGSSINHLRLEGNAIADLGPLADCELKNLWVFDNPATDLSPLAGTGIENLDITGMSITTFGPLLADPPEHLRFGGPGIPPELLDRLAARFLELDRHLDAHFASSLAALLRGDAEALRAAAVPVEGRRVNLIPFPVTHAEALERSATMGARLPRVDAAFHDALQDLVSKHLDLWIDLQAVEGELRYLDGSAAQAPEVEAPDEDGPAFWRRGAIRFATPDPDDPPKRSILLLVWPNASP